MRNIFADTFYDISLENQRTVIVVADISPAGSISKFRNKFPNRFINTGVAEQIMIGMCSGLALSGMQPFAYTIATFSLYRPFEFIRNDICYQNLPVTVVGIGGGLTYSTLGATHHAMEDISIASSIPNMSVIVPCDPDEVRIITKWCINENKGPVYLRLGKAGEPSLTNTADNFKIGKLRKLKQGNNMNVCMLSCGPITKYCFNVYDNIYNKYGIKISIYCIHMIKPIDKNGIIKLCNKYSNIVILEEHISFGGLGYGIKEILFDNNIFCNLYHFSLKDKFIHSYGSHDDILLKHGISINNITNCVLNILGKSTV